ncbi:fatty-acid-binding protein 2 isoform X2 [Euphorbia lathyris]|uniref:fatty-acid-binding protein 2 isoform X2 n=1 Tax=Euphorbia lathyris TaxID=212925 RepID=UPI003313A53B
MRNNWLFFMNLDDRSSYIMPGEPLLSPNDGGHIFSHLSPFVDNSLRQSRFLYIPGSMAFQEALICMSKLAGALLFWFTSASSSNLSQQLSSNQHGLRPGSNQCPVQMKNITSTRHNLIGFRFGSNSRREFSSPQIFGKISSFMIRLLHREAERLQSLSVLSLASALVPPFDNLSSKVLAVPSENGDVRLPASMDQRPCEVARHGCSSLAFHDLNWTRHAVEPKTGIEFPMMLDNNLAGENKSNITSEVLVGTGSRTMRIIKIKSLKVYAFGFYIHPNSMCKKLGSKYASVPEGELSKCHNFYKDLLREDIGMTVRLVINCNGMKINSVKDAFEKSLRNRLLKTNPDTDYNCLTTFGSLFTKDIPIPLGTTVDFRRTADGKLITEIGGNQIGEVHSKDLCRAFFDMYIGDIPVSEQTKEEIGKNVANIMRRC